MPLPWSQQQSTRPLAATLNLAHCFLPLPPQPPVAPTIPVVVSRPAPPRPSLAPELPITIAHRGAPCEMLTVSMVNHLFEVGTKLRLGELEICELIRLAVYKLRNSASLQAHQHPTSLARIISLVHPLQLGQMDERMGLHYLAILMIQKTKTESEIVFNKVGASKRGSGSFDRFYRLILHKEPFNAPLPFVWPIVPARI